MAVSAAIAAIGLALMAAPGVLGYDGLPRTIHLVTGPLIGALGIVSLWAIARPLRRVSYLLGLATVIGSAVGDPPVAALVVGIVAGALAAVLALAPVNTAALFGGGWTSLVDDARLPTETGGTVSTGRGGRQR